MRSFPVYLALLLPACGSKIDGGPSNRVQIKSTSDAIATGGNGSCTISAPQPALVAKGFTKQNINALTLTSQDGRTKSLCDNLVDMNSPVGIVQFAGVTCLSCQQEAQFFTSKLGLTQTYGNKNLHTGALTDLLTDYQESDFVRFMKTYAPQSLRMHDANTTLWRFFSADPNEPTRPTIIAYNRYGWSYIINTENRTADEILAAAQLLVEQSPAQNPNPPSNSGDQQPMPMPMPTAQPTAMPTSAPLPTTGPTPAPTAAPTKPAAALTAAQNVALTGGASGDTVASYFGDNNYLIIDLSQYNCTYCRQLASQHQSDTKFQTAMQSGKCTALTVVPGSEISSWQRLYPTSTYAGRTSRGVASEGNFARAFSLDFNATPTVFMIDRTGKVVDSAVGEFPAKVSSLCY